MTIMSILVIYSIQHLFQNVTLLKAKLAFKKVYIIEGR
jgi:hypothetical protein